MQPALAEMRPLAIGLLAVLPILASKSDSITYPNAWEDMAMDWVAKRKASPLKAPIPISGEWK
jgi:hypothetical protein